VTKKDVILTLNEVKGKNLTVLRAGSGVAISRLPSPLAAEGGFD